MDEKQFNLDKEAFGFFLDENGNPRTNPRAAIDCIAETMLDAKYPGSEWLDKEIDLLFDGYIKKYPRPGFMTKHLLIIIAKYLEVRDVHASKSKLFENLDWWLRVSEGHFKWLIETFAQEDDQLRWALRMTLRRFIRHAERNNLPASYALNVAKTKLLDVDPEFLNDATVVFVDPAKENARVYSFQRPFRFTHDAFPSK